MDQERRRKLIVAEWVTLDGVMQAPGLPNEDTEGGFKHGGWQPQYFDEAFAGVVMETFDASDAFLLGRKTYDIFSGYWPTSQEPIAKTINSITKHVASRTRDTLEWQNSILIKGDVAPEVAKLKEQAGKSVLVLGSGELVQTLMRHNLVDEYQLMVHPLVLGSGKRLFREGSRRPALTLLSSKTTTKGVLILKYQAASEGHG
jgi:dihydrofolate reductase